MVLELIIIGGAIYYFAKKNKENKAKRVTFASGQPWFNHDGSVTYPPGYPGLPPYTARDNEHQILVQRHRGCYADAPVVQDEKAPLIVQSREVTGSMTEKN